MKKFLLAAVVAASLPTVSFGQEIEDIDIEIGFDDFMNPTEIEIETPFPRFNNAGVGIADGEFTGLFDDLATDNPGFITPATEDEEGRFNPGDAISLAFRDSTSSGGQGYVTFFNPTTGALEASSSSITITNQDGGVGGTTVIDGDTLTGESSLLIAVASDGFTLSNIPGVPDDENVTLGVGEIHNHLSFDLEGNDQGAFGIFVQFEADTDGDGVANFDSDEFFLVFNSGLDDAGFATALAAFEATGVAVPEPSSCIAMGAIVAGILTRRRRRI